MDLLICSKSRQ